MKDFPGVHWQAQKQPNLFSYPVSVPAQHFPLLLPAEAFRAPRGVWDVPPHPEISITAAGVLMPLGTLALGKAQASPHSPWLSVLTVLGFQCLPPSPDGNLEFGCRDM